VKMWSGRFREPLDPAFERWQRSFPFDRRLLKYELQASGAYARALRKVGVLSTEELASIEAGLDQIAEKALTSPNFLNDDEAEDVHHLLRNTSPLSSAMSALNFTAGVAATNRLRLTCGFTCARALTNFAHLWRN
jgi:argininosuccinate lyase